MTAITTVWSESLWSFPESSAAGNSWSERLSNGCPDKYILTTQIAMLHAKTVLEQGPAFSLKCSAKLMVDFMCVFAVMWFMGTSSWSGVGKGKARAHIMHSWIGWYLKQHTSIGPARKFSTQQFIKQSGRDSSALACGWPHIASVHWCKI